MARQSLLLEEFLTKELQAGHPLFARKHAGVGGKVLLHGHCHQKALVGTAPTVAVLKAAGYQVSEVDAGCCGMAGSFGFEAEHYDLSVRIAERAPAPAVRAAGATSRCVRPNLVSPASRACDGPRAEASGRAPLGGPRAVTRPCAALRAGRTRSDERRRPDRADLDRWARQRRGSSVRQRGPSASASR